MDLQEIIQSNRTILQQSRTLNRRAGTDIFPIPSHNQLQEMLTVVLAGAGRIQDIQNLDTLRLPELDHETVKLVTDENPDEIIVLGRRYVVDYHTQHEPRITFDTSTIITCEWRSLPDEGIKLPNGRIIEILVQFGYRSFISRNFCEVKEHLAKVANVAIWESWKLNPSPTITLPDPTDPASIVPEIMECQYGTSVIDDSPLIAFGVITPKTNRYYRTDPWFESKWLQDRELARQFRQQSVEKLDQIREEAIKEKKYSEASSAKQKLWELDSHADKNRLSEELRARIIHNCCNWASNDLNELPNILTLISEVEEALKQIEFKRTHQREHSTALIAHIGGNTDLAERIDNFVRDCMDLHGSDAIALLKTEADAEYGRKRRAEAIALKFKGVKHQGLDWAQGRDICHAVFWAEYLSTIPESPPATAKATPIRTTDIRVDTLTALQARFGSKKQKR